MHISPGYPPDPRSLSLYPQEPPPRFFDYQRKYARIGIAFAITFEGAFVVFLLIVGKTIVLFGLIDGMDECCGILALLVGAGLSFIGWTLGSAYGAIAYSQAYNDWLRRQRGRQ